MTLSSEVLRILAKDVRVLRWPLAGWIALLGLSVARGLGVLPSLHTALFPITVLVPIAAAILVALAVTADPAESGPTFWGVHGQRPLAMAAAKSAMVILLLVLMAGGHALVLRSHGLTSDQLIALVAAAARDTGAWLLFSATLAACARDAKGWLVGGVLVLVLSLLLSAANDHTGILTILSLTRGSASVLLTVVSVSVMAWTYRSHLTGLPASARTAALLVIAACVLVRPRESMAHPVESRSLQRDSAMRIHTDGISARIEGRAVIVDVPVTYPDSSVVEAATVAWRLHLVDGSTTDLFMGAARIRRMARLLEPEEGFASWGHGRVQRVLEFRYPLDSATLARVDGKLASVSVALETDRRTMRRIASFSARRGGTVAHQGLRLQLAAPTQDGRFDLGVSRVSIPTVAARLPSTVRFRVPDPMLAVIPIDGSAVRYLAASTLQSNDEGRRSPNWVLPGNELVGGVTALIAEGGTNVAGGTIVAIAGEYAGRTAETIKAPYKP